MSEQAPRVSHSEISDLVTVDGRDRAHRPNGHFMSQYEVEQIDAHEDLIRNNMPEHPANEEEPSENPETGDLHEIITQLEERLAAVEAQIKSLEEDRDALRDALDEMRNKIGDGNPEDPEPGNPEDPEPGNPEDPEPGNPEDPEPGNPEEGAEVFTPSRESLEKLGEARQHFAELTARDRTSLWSRFFKKDTFLGKFLASSPLVADFIDSANRRGGSEEMERAEEEYRSAMDSIQDQIKEFYEDKVSEEELKAMELAELASEDAKLEASISRQVKRLSKATDRFTNWWVNQPSDWRGALRKAGISLVAGAGIGAITLVTGGAALGVIGSAGAAAAATGAFTGRHVNLRRANALLEKADGERVVIADDEARIAHEKKEEELKRDPSSGVITRETEKATDKDVYNRRRRQIGLVALGGAFSEAHSTVFNFDRARWYDEEDKAKREM